MPEAGRSDSFSVLPLRQRHQGVAHGDRVPGLHRDTAYRPDLRGADFGFHLHGFQESATRIAFGPPSPLASVAITAPDVARQRRGDRGAGACRGRWQEQKGGRCSRSEPG